MRWMLMFVSLPVLAESAAHESSHGIPWGSLFVQGFNFFLLFALLAFVLRKSLTAHFETRSREYHQLVERAEEAKREAERGRTEIAGRLARLEAEADNTVIQAHSEAEELKSRMMNEARQLSEKMSQEAERTARIELDRAKSLLRKELLDNALQASQKNLEKGLGSSEQKRLQNEFVEKIQVVGG